VVSAVAYDKAAFDAGKADGIPPELADQWRRATAQAAVGVNAALPATTLVASKPSGYVAGGSTVTLGATGLQPGERYTLVVHRVKRVLGIADSGGRALAAIALPETTRDHSLVVTGSRSNRTVETTVPALGRTTLTAGLRSSRVGRGNIQRVRISGLAPGESTTLSYRGSRIWSGTANVDGQVVDEFRVGRTVARVKLSARGAFADRTVTTYFRVVR